jgi:hypothetical protein
MGGNFFLVTTYVAGAEKLKIKSINVFSVCNTTQRIA